MNTALKNSLAQADTLKARLQATRPLHVEALNKIKAAFEMEYTYESNKMEGNTLTLQETALVVSEGVTIGGKQAIEFIKDIACSDIAINERTVKEIHAIILHGINKEQAGKYRDVPVMIVGSKHTPPQPYLIVPQMEQFVRDYEAMQNQNEHPVLISAFLHDELVKIHPFIDGNGRTSRLLMNLYLLSKGYPITVLKGDNESRLAYYTALEQSHTGNNKEPFYCFVAKAVKQSMESYIAIVEG